VVAHDDGAVGDVHHCSLPPVSPPASPGVAGPARVEGPLLSPPSGPSWQGGTVTAPSTPVRLTSYAAGGGCACKIPPGELAELVGGLALPVLPDVLVGTGDDAGVVRVAPDLAVVSTADFFTPLLDDPYDFGRVAAANALSDVYAMGGRPVMAVNLVGWPRERLPREVLAEVLRGGADTAAAAGVPVVGGHSIDDPEPKYGMAVTGVVHPDR